MEATRSTSAERRDERFLLSCAVAAVAGCLVATVTPLIAGTSAAFTGSLVTSGVLGALLAARNLRLFRRNRAVALATAVLTAVFGIWSIESARRKPTSLLVG